MRAAIIIAMIVIGVMIGVQVRLCVSIIGIMRQLDEMDQQIGVVAVNTEYNKRNTDVIGFEVMRHEQTISECRRFFDLGVVPIN